MKTSFKELSPQELQEKLSQLRKESFELRMQKAAGKLDKPHRLRINRRQMAQVLTFLKGAVR